MIRGTVTPFKFILPCANNELDWATILFSQSNNPSMALPIIKTLDDCGPRNDSNDLDGSRDLYVSLTATETAIFSDRYKAKLQMRAKPIDGVEFGCKSKLITVYPMDDDLIQENPEMPPAVDGWVVFDGDEII